MPSSSNMQADSIDARGFVANHARDWTMLISPVAWYRCFELLVAIRWPSRKWRWGHHILVLLSLGLVGVWCYLFWLLTFNKGAYLKLLSSFASEATNATASEIAAAYTTYQNKYNSDIVVTVLIVVFIAVVYALILTLESVLAAMWRRGIYDQLFTQQFSSDEDAAAAILWHTSRSGYASCLFDAHGKILRIVDLPSRMSTELHQFTVSFGTTLFGGLFYNGLLEMVPVIVLFEQHIADQPGDGTSGIALCFGAFFFCWLLLMIVNLFYSRWNRFVLYYRAELHTLVQKLLKFAESIAFYGTSTSMELPRLRALLSQLQHYSALLSPAYGCVNFSIALLGTMGSVVTYILPAVLFFYLRDSSNQTPADANAYLSIVSFYSSLFNQLANFLYLCEALMITLNLGNRIYELRAHMRTIHRAWKDISALERLTHRRRHHQESDAICFEISHLKVLIPTTRAEGSQRLLTPVRGSRRDGIAPTLLSSLVPPPAVSRFTVLQDDFCVAKLAYGESLLLFGQSGCGKTSIFRICAGLWPIDVQLANDAVSVANSDKECWKNWRRRIHQLPMRRSRSSSVELLTNSSPCNSPSSHQSFVTLPPHVLFVPQKPYHCIGSLRDQLLMLLSADERDGITLLQLMSLLSLANLTYLAHRFGFEHTCDWEQVLSLGEQQKIAFLRVLAAPHLLLAGSRLPFLLLLDESTSAMDVVSERQLYQALQSHNLWYISISHRPSLKSYHQRVLNVEQAWLTDREEVAPLDDSRMCRELYIEDDWSFVSSSMATAGADAKSRFGDSQQVEDPPSPVRHASFSTPLINKSHGRLARALGWLRGSLRTLFAIFLVLHVPFETNTAGRWLRVKTYVAWGLTLMCAIIHVYYTYKLAVSTFSVFSVIGDYASEAITFEEAKLTISNQIGSVMALNIGTLIAYSATMALGQYLASLYTLRQSQYFAAVMLNNSRIYFMQQQQHQYQLLQQNSASASRPGRLNLIPSLAQLPTLLSQDIATLNSNLFFFLCGSIYYSGALTILGQLIALGHLLAEQVDGTSMLEILFVTIVIMSVLEAISLLPYIHFESISQKTFDAFAWMLQRIDLQAEQVALSPPVIRHSEARQLHRALVSSCIAQMRAGLSYGLFCFSSYLSHRVDNVLQLVLPAIVFFVCTESSKRTADNANSLVAVSVYVSLIQAYFNYIVLGIGYPWAQMWITGQRVIDAQTALLLRKHTIAVSKPHEQNHDRKSEPSASAASDAGPLILTDEDYNDPGESHTISFEVKHLNLCDIYPEQSEVSTTLIRDLNFTLLRRNNLLIRGPSGCGKSQLLRLLAGLLPTSTETALSPRGPGACRIFRPAPMQCIFLSQRLYLIRGTLREQINYFVRARQLPDVIDMRAALERVRLGYLLHRFDMDALIDWEGVLSCGEQQRLVLCAALACPHVTCIILDETTAACDLAVELEIYTILQQSGKQFISVSHRPEMARFHKCILTLDPQSRSFTWSEQRQQTLSDSESDYVSTVV